MTVLNSLGSNSGLFTPTFAASATLIPANYKIQFLIAALGKNENKGSGNYLRIITQVRGLQREQNEEV